MSEDLSAMIRVGVTIILVAALVAAVLNMMVVAQSSLSTGMSKLQSGVDQISLQEFSNYNQKKVSGTEVSSALTLYQGRDIAILICPAAYLDTSGNATKFDSYGALLNGASSTTDTSGTVYQVAASSLTRASAGDSFYTSAFQMNATTGAIESYFNIKGTTMSGSDHYILSSARFYSELLKNSAGQIIGIAFTQQK